VNLLNISWDVWDHRHKILHDSSHPWNMLHVNELNQQIDEEYGRGYINLLWKDYKWLQRPLPTIKKLSLEAKPAVACLHPIV
jgi:hypothetical protein